MKTIKELTTEHLTLMQHMIFGISVRTHLEEKLIKEITIFDPAFVLIKESPFDGWEIEKAVLTDDGRAYLNRVIEK